MRHKQHEQLLLVLATLLLFTSKASALTFGTYQCFAKWSAPFNTPQTVSGSITMAYTYTCNPGHAIDHVQLAFGCADSTTPDHSCPTTWTGQSGYLAPQANSGSISWNTAQLPANATPPNLVIADGTYDVTVWLIESGVIIGATVAGCNASNVCSQVWFAEEPDAADCCAFDGMDGEFVRSTFSKKFPAASTGTGAFIPRVTTETNWCGTDGGITEDLKGKMETALYLDAVVRGWTYTFIYQMKDDSDACGLFDSGNNHNLTTILADNSSAFTPAPITYSVVGATGNIHSLLMQKSNGKYELAVWDEAFQSLAATNVIVQLDMVRSVNIYDVTKGTAPVSTFSGQNVPLTLSDHAMILEF